MRRTLYGTTVTRLALPVAARSTAATVNGTTIDRSDPSGGADFTQVALFAIVTGVVTDGTHTFAVQDSDDGSSWAAASAEYLQGSVPAVSSADDNAVFEVGYIGPKRYIRVTVTTAGATTGGIFGATVTLSGGRRGNVSR